MTTQSTENASLPNMSNMPTENFQNDMRDWFVKGDVARILNSKLRKELFELLTKTELGQRLLSSNDLSTYRLILSPLVLGLNTLVAEFLYAQNCHCTLSVYCAEVPYHNTLPYFESQSKFRFSIEEVEEIFEAMCGHQDIEDIKNDIACIYAEDDNASLLLVILKVLISYIGNKKGVTKSTSHHSKRTHHSLGYIETESASVASEESGKKSSEDLKTEIYNTNFRYLNKYLIILSKNVKEMTQQISELQSLDGGRLKMSANRSSSARKFENLNRSLERMTHNLMEMSREKRCSKQVSAILAAIKTLSKEFTRCTANFEAISKDILKQQQTRVAVTRQAEKQTETEPREKTYMDWIREMRNTDNGKLFLEKINCALDKLIKKQSEQLRNEMEITLKHQRELLKLQYNQKLMENLTNFATKQKISESRTPRDLEEKLKIYEKEHLHLLEKLDELEAVKMQLQEEKAKHNPNRRSSPLPAESAMNPSQPQFYAPSEQSVVPPRTSSHYPNPAHSSMPHATSQESLDVQPSTSKQAQISAQPPQSVEMQNAAPAVMPHQTSFPQLPKQDVHTNERQCSPLSMQDKKEKTKMLFEDTQKQFEKILQEIKGQDQGVQNVLFDAKLRVKELEDESNQLDQSIQQYLERQRKENEATRARIEELNLERKEFLQRKSVMTPKSSNEFRKSLLANLEDDIAQDIKKFEQQSDESRRPFRRQCTTRSTNEQSNMLLTKEYRNPLVEIKERFLSEQAQKHGDDLGREPAIPELILADNMIHQQPVNVTVAPTDIPLTKPQELAAANGMEKDLSLLQLVISSSSISEEQIPITDIHKSQSIDSMESLSDSISEEVSSVLSDSLSEVGEIRNKPTPTKRRKPIKKKDKNPHNLQAQKNETRQLKSTEATRQTEKYKVGIDFKRKNQTEASTSEFILSKMPTVSMKSTVLQKSLTKMQQIFAQVPDEKETDCHEFLPTEDKKEETNKKQALSVPNPKTASVIGDKNEKLAMPPDDDVNNNKNIRQQQQQKQIGDFIGAKDTKTTALGMNFEYLDNVTTTATTATTTMAKSALVATATSTTASAPTNRTYLATFSYSKHDSEMSRLRKKGTAAENKSNNNSNSNSPTSSSSSAINHKSNSIKSPKVAKKPNQEQQAEIKLQEMVQPIADATLDISDSFSSSEEFHISDMGGGRGRGSRKGSESGSEFWG